MRGFRGTKPTGTSGETSALQRSDHKLKGHGHVSRRRLKKFQTHLSCWLLKRSWGLPRQWLQGAKHATSSVKKPRHWRNLLSYQPKKLQGSKDKKERKNYFSLFTRQTVTGRAYLIRAPKIRVVLPAHLPREKYSCHLYLRGDTLFKPPGASYAIRSLTLARTGNTSRTPSALERW